MLSGYTLKPLAAIGIYIYMYSVNKKRDRETSSQVPPSSLATDGQKVCNSSQEEKEAIERGMRDVTELDNPGFRYVL
jgi:hypothetical protein